MKKYNINLSPKSEERFSEKLVFFLLHYLRYIIVLTQIVVISVFFFRFTVDQEIVDLKESVAQKQEIIRVTAPLVTEARAVSLRIGDVKGMMDRQSRFKSDLDYLFSIVPPQIRLKSFDIDERSANFSGLATNITSIRAFYERIRRNERYSNVIINSITKTDLNFEFSFLVTFQDG